MSTQIDHNVPLTMVPSLPAASFAELRALTEALDGVSAGFQIDVVDGNFAPFTSWPFNQPDVPNEWEKIKTLPESYAYELDCMIDHPEQYLSVFATLPLAKVIVHVGSTNAYGTLIAHARQHGYQIGLAFTNDVPLSFLTPYLGTIDFVQIMGIAAVGRQGQPFDERTLVSARTLREQHPELFIAVDGSVNAETIPQLIAAGVNHFAPGSAISHAKDPAAAYRELSTLLT